MLLPLIALVSFSQVTWTQDPAFDKAVTVQADCEPAYVLVQRLSEALGKPLSAGASVAQDPVVLFAKNTPVREVMAVLAEHFKWEWHYTDSGALELWQSPVMQAAERREVRDWELYTYRAMAEEAKKRLKAREEADLQQSSAEFEKAIEELSQLQEELQSVGNALPKEKQQELYKRIGELSSTCQRLGQLLSPYHELAERTLAGLASGDMERLHKTTRLVFSDAPIGSQRKFDSASRAAARKLIEQASYESLYEGQRPMSVRLRSQFTALNSSQRFVPEDVASVRVELRASSSSPGSSHSVPVNVYILGKSGSNLFNQQYYVPVHFPNVNRSSSLNHPKFREPLVLPPSLLEELGIKSGQMADVSETSFREFLRPGSDVLPARNLGKLLNGAAESSEFNFVGHAYQLFQRNQRWNVPLAQRAQFFYMFAGATGNRAIEKDGWIRFSDALLPLSRAYSLPTDELFRMRDLAAEPLTLDRLARVAMMASDPQLAHPTVMALLMSRWHVSFGTIDPLPHFLRFWHSLSVGARNKLLQGEPLGLGTLSTRQRQQLWAATIRLNGLVAISVGSQNFSGPDNTLARWHNELLGDRQVLHGADLADMVLIGAGMLTLLSQRHEVISLEFKNSPGYRQLLTPQEFVNHGIYQADSDQYRLEHMERLRYLASLRFAEGPGVGFAVQGGNSLDGKVYDRPSELPQELRKRLDAIKNGG